MPFLSPNRQCQSTEAKNITFRGLAHPKLTWGSFNLSLLPLIAPGYLCGGLPCLSSVLWCQYPIYTNCLLDINVPVKHSWCGSKIPPLQQSFDLSTSKWGDGSPVSWASVLPIFSFLRPSILDLGSGTGQTDGQTDRQWSSMRYASILRCGSGDEWLGNWTCNQQVANLNPGHPGQIVYTHVPLSPSSIIWYWPTGGNAQQLGR